MQITTKKGANIIILELSGRFDAIVVPQFKNFIAKLMREGNNRYVIDMHGVTYIDSGGLGILVSFLRQVRLTKGDIKIASLDSRVRAVFELTRLHRIFEIFDDAKIAVQSFS